MHHTRLVGGLISLAALLTILLVPSALFADTPAMTTPSPGATPGPTPAGSPTTVPASATPTPGVTATPSVTRPRLTEAQRRAKLRALRLAHKRSLVLRITRRQLGVPYVYGGASRGGFDCSGLTMYVYRRLGWNLPHGATDQASAAGASRCGGSRSATWCSTADPATTATWASTPATGASSTRPTAAPW